MRLSSDARNPTTGRMVGLIANLELGRLNNQKPEGRGGWLLACDITRARTRDNTLPYLGKRLLAIAAPDFDFCTRLIDGTFPIYESQIPPASRNAVTCCRAELLAALHRLLAVCNAEPPPLVALSWRSEGRLCSARAATPLTHRRPAQPVLRCRSGRSSA